jgi:SAM-dependent methyltransferase
MSRPDGWLKLHLRRVAPEPVKRLLRLARLALASPPPAAPELPQSALDGCRVLSSRTAMLDRLPKEGVAIELGVLRGDFSRQILARAMPSVLHLVDIDFGPLASDIRGDPSVRLHRGLTLEVMPGFPDAAFDFIYVDADHSYPAVRRDIGLAVPKLKPGGIIAFNDFARIVRPGLGTFGVHQAVSEFIVERQWEVAYFCFDGEALYDIALRKPRV